MSFAAGTLLFSPGELDDKLYIILSGEIALIADPGTAHERVVAMRGWLSWTEVRVGTRFRA